MLCVNLKLCEKIVNTLFQLSADRVRLGGPRDLLVYFSLPPSHTGQQLVSYGGFLRYKIKFSSRGTDHLLVGPDVIIVVNDLCLFKIFINNYEIIVCCLI